MDLNPIAVPNNVLTNCLNGTYVTFNGNEVILQNDMGNGKIESAKLPPGYIPIGIKEYGGIIYVVSYNPFTQNGQIGSFPSPKVDFDGDDLESRDITIKNTDFFDEDLTTTSVKKYLDSDEVIKVGDLFEVCVIDNISADPENILKILNDVRNWNVNPTSIKEGRKILNIKLAAIDLNNNINYLTLDYNDIYKNNIDQILGNFFIPINKELADVETYEVYTYSRNAKLMIIAELESLDSLTLSVEPISTTSYTYEFKAKIEPYYFWRWLEIKYTYSENGENSITQSYYIKNLHPNDFDEYQMYQSNIEVLSGVSESLFPLGSNVDNLNNYVDADENSIISWTLTASEQNTIIDYEVIPHMIYSPVESLKKTGRLNVRRYDDTYVELTRWKYKTDETNYLNINWGIDYNSRTNEKLYRIDFKFSELTDPDVNDSYTFTTYAGSFNSDNTPIYSLFTSSNYITSIEVGRRKNLQKDKLYLCTIMYYTIDINNVDVNTLNENSNWTLWETHNRFVYTNNVMDNYYDITDDFSTIIPDVNITIEPYYNYIRNADLVATEDYRNDSSFLSYSPGRSFWTEVIKTTNFTIDVNAKSKIDYNFTYNINFSNPALLVNSGINYQSVNNQSGGRRIDNLPTFTPIITNRVNISNGTVSTDRTLSTTPTQELIWNVDKYVDNIFLKNTIFSINEQNCNVQIDNNSIFSNSRRFEFSSINKSSFTVGKKQDDVTEVRKARVLEKYYSDKYYKDIFGYPIGPNETSLVNAKPKPTRAYTHCQVHFIRDNGFLSSDTYSTADNKQAKTYIQFSPQGIPTTLMTNWTSWTDVLNSTSNLNYTDLPSVGLYSSRITRVNQADINNGATVKYSNDYLLYANNLGSSTWETEVSQNTVTSWCFPLIKTSLNKYALIFVPFNIPVTALTKPMTWRSTINYSAMAPEDKLSDVLYNMFYDKYLFQVVNLNNSSLYIPDPTSYSYTTYDVEHKMYAKVLGTPISNTISLNGLNISEDNVIQSCANHNYSIDLNNTNFNNVNLNVKYINSIVEIPIKVKSADFTLLRYNTDNWTDSLNDRLFIIEGNNIKDITNSVDSNGILYNKNNYYIINNDNTFKKGEGVWFVEDTLNEYFRELRLNTESLTTAATNLRVGKIVLNYDGEFWEDCWESMETSRSGVFTGVSIVYNTLHEYPYNYDIFAHPVNWD